MTALVVSNIYQISDTIKISKQAIEQEGNEVALKVGEKLSVDELLHIMLIESSNDAAYSLATPGFKTQKMSEKSFVDLMNLYASYTLGLNPENTHFINSNNIINYETKLVKIFHTIHNSSCTWLASNRRVSNVY